MDAKTRERLVHAKELFARSDFAGAEPFLLDIVARHASLADVHDMLGVIAHASGDFATAEERFETALRINPSYTEAALNLAVIYNERGRYEEARDLYTRVVGRTSRTSDPEPKSLVPSSAPANSLAGDPFVRGKIANMHADLAAAYRGAGLLDSAIAELEKAVELCPDFVDLRTQLGRLYRAQATDALTPSVPRERALHHFREVLTKRPSYVDARLQLGLVLQELGRPGDAESAFEEVLRFSDHPQARLYLRALKQRHTND